VIKFASMATGDYESASRVTALQFTRAQVRQLKTFVGEAGVDAVIGAPPGETWTPRGWLEEQFARIENGSGNRIIVVHTGWNGNENVGAIHEARQLRATIMHVLKRLKLGARTRHAYHLHLAELDQLLGISAIETLSRLA